MATMQLTSLSIVENWTQGLWHSLIGSNLSRTLEAICISNDYYPEPDRDVQGLVARALAACCNLKSIHMHTARWSLRLNAAVVVAAGCPLLADVTIYLTVQAFRHIRNHRLCLKKCSVLNPSAEGRRAPAKFLSLEGLRSNHPSVHWEYPNS